MGFLILRIYKKANRITREVAFNESMEIIGKDE